MIEHGGVFLPDGEEHLVEWMDAKDRWVDGKLTYQYHKQEAALRYVRRFRTAIDIGAHVGLWTMHLTKRFKAVLAFEPVAAHRECFRRNVSAANVQLWACALGELSRAVSIRTGPTSSGDSWVDGAGDIPLRRLDDFLLIEDVDFIKLDCEGYELFALRGGERILRQYRPCVCVEQKPGKAQRFGLGETDAVKYLESLGATVREEISGDFIMTFD